MGTLRDLRDESLRGALIPEECKRKEQEHGIMREGDRSTLADILAFTTEHNDWFSINTVFH